MDYLSYLKPGTVLDTLALAKDRLKPSLGDLAQQIFQGVQYYQQAKSQKLQEELAKKELAIKERYANTDEKKADQEIAQSKWYTGERWPAEFGLMKNKDDREEKAYPFEMFSNLSKAVGSGGISKEAAADFFGRATGTPVNPNIFDTANKLWELYSKGKSAETENIEADTKYKGAATKNIGVRGGGAGSGGSGGQGGNKEYYLTDEKTTNALDGLYTNTGGNPLDFATGLNKMLDLMNPLEKMAVYFKADQMWRARTGSSLEASVLDAQSKVLNPGAGSEPPAPKPPARPAATGQTPPTPPPIPPGEGAAGWNPWDSLNQYSNQGGSGYAWE